MQLRKELESSAGLATCTFPNEIVLELADELATITPGNFGKKFGLGIPVVMRVGRRTNYFLWQ